MRPSMLSGNFVQTVDGAIDDPAEWCAHCRDREWTRITTRYRLDPGDPIGRMLGLVEPMTEEQRAEIRRRVKAGQRRSAG